MEKLYNLIGAHQVLSFTIAFFLFICLILLTFRFLFKDQFKETWNAFVEKHIAQDFDDEPYNKNFK